MQLIKFSRHAKRRIKLYRIPESVVIDIIRDQDAPPGHYEIVRSVVGFVLPIKVVFDQYEDRIVVITAYPLKRRKP